MPSTTSPVSLLSKCGTTRNPAPPRFILTRFGPSLPLPDWPRRHGLPRPCTMFCAWLSPMLDCQRPGAVDTVRAYQ
jgi:hypothetical protein